MKRFNIQIGLRNILRHRLILLATMVAGLAISQLISAIRTNPAKSLKYE